MTTKTLSVRYYFAVFWELAVSNLQIFFFLFSHWEINKFIKVVPRKRNPVIFVFLDVCANILPSMWPLLCTKVDAFSGWILMYHCNFCKEFIWKKKEKKKKLQWCISDLTYYEPYWLPFYLHLILQLTVLILNCENQTWTNENFHLLTQSVWGPAFWQR